MHLIKCSKIPKNPPPPLLFILMNKAYMYLMTSYINVVL